MSLHVICPGCLKRFQVSLRFAGMKGPCPNCGTVIDIPKESVKIHSTDDIPGADDEKSGKTKSGKTLHRPIPRLDMEFDPVAAGRYSLGVLSVLLLAFLLGCIPIYDTLRSLIGILGLCLIAFPLALFGYHTLQDRELMFNFVSEELYRRTGLVAAGYVILWLTLECFLGATRADMYVSWFYFAVIAGLATLLAIPLLAIKLQNAFLHYCLFSFSVILCRFLLGLGWFWQSSEFIRHSAAPPPPLLPGM